MTVVSDRLFFAADDGVIGLEPWVVESVSDLDRDGVPNRTDSCWLTANTRQNDIDGDGGVQPSDLARMRQLFSKTPRPGLGDGLCADAVF